ncbi:unnamed protein product, partial [Gongylonema pulchrum]|uniref:PRKG1_interact domain-containing protein n=1 Tax=Gongylonema pulchrum TaxID=637853 RepID=A0A183D5B7_9BILA
KIYRCAAAPAAGHSGSEVGGNTTDETSFSDAEDNAREREFDAAYDSVNLTRIDSMTREEIIQEYMTLDKDNCRLLSRLNSLQWQNERLKQRLKENSIAYDDLLVPAKRCRSGTSASEASEARRSFDEMMMVDNAARLS